MSDSAPSTTDAVSEKKDFIRQIVREDLASGKHHAIKTRFPPEPNGYLHIGHAKAICLDFGIAAEFGGVCNLRLDDTNPAREDPEYVRAIQDDVRWLGFDWHSLRHASDYFGVYYLAAEKLIADGKAFVCDLSAEQVREYRGTLTEPGRNSPFRERSVEENLDLFRRMRAGEFADGARTLRAKIDMASGNINLRDPALYRRFFPTVEYRPVLPGPGEPIEQRLAEVGVDFDEIHTVAVSHLHHDHAGGLKLFAGKVPVHAQRRELEYGLSNHPEPERNAINRIDFDDPNIDWLLADGEAEIAPGITAVPTYGHTPGHQSFVVELDSSVGGDGFVFAFDAADLTENIEHELPIGGFIDVDPAETVEPIRRLKKLAADKGYELVPGHDPHVWPELTHRLEERFGPLRPR